MKENKSVVKHNACLATVTDGREWVKSHARELDIENEMDVAWTLCGIMSYYQKLHDFAAVSSNNIYWEMTDVPVRMLYIPFNKRFISLINPKYIKLSGKSVDSAERCGSIPGKSYVVKRKTYVSISGYNMDGEYTELEYGCKKGNAGLNSDSWVIQHEMDHLDGILIKDKAIM